MKDGYWVSDHLGHYQEIKSNSLEHYVVENDVVKGSDEDKGDLTHGKCARAYRGD